MTDGIATTAGNASFICCILKVDNETKFPSSVLPDAAVQNLYFSPYSFLVSHNLFRLLDFTLLTFAYQNGPGLQLLQVVTVTNVSVDHQ